MIPVVEAFNPPTYLLASAYHPKITWCWTFCLFAQCNLMHVKEVEAFNPATFLPLCVYKTWNFLNILLEQDSQIIQFYLRKTPNRDIGQKLRKEDVLLIYFKQFFSFVPFSTQILNHSNCFVKALAWIRQISQIGWFSAHILENFTKIPRLAHTSPANIEEYSKGVHPS